MGRVGWGSSEDTGTEQLNVEVRKGTFLKTFLRLSVEAYTLRLEGQRQENCLEF